MTALIQNELNSIYDLMLMTRMLDSKILSLQRQGKIGPYVPCTGEEAAIVASAFALGKEDWMFTSYREMGAHLARGMGPDKILAQLFGNCDDLLKGRQMSNSWGSRALNSVPTAAPIGAYLPVAVGVAHAMKLNEKDDRAVLAYLGDGGTSSSDFHVAMNFAGVFKVPIVFLVRNNGWAISLPVKKQTASETLAIKARAYGLEGIRVDGNDAVTVYKATKSALLKARSGAPSLIEAITYRLGPHSTADDPKRYREDPSLSEMEDPIERLKGVLVSRGLWDQKEQERKIKEYEETISKIVKAEEAKRPVSPSELFFDDVYSSPIPSLEEQRKEFTSSL